MTINIFKIILFLSEVQSREEGLKPSSNLIKTWSETPFRSTIQRRRIETSFKSKRIACKIEILSEVQSREEGLKLYQALEPTYFPGTFRSTIQRRRIETELFVPDVSLPHNFQKYNPEKKDWNVVKCVKLQSEYHSFRSTIQRRRIETYTLCPEKVCYWSVFQKYNPEKKDWNDHNHSNDKTECKPFRSTIQRRRIETTTTLILKRRRPIFQKYNPEKKDWNGGVLWCGCLAYRLSEVQSREEGLKPALYSPRGFCPRLSEVQSREEGLKLRHDSIASLYCSTFRSTIQRRRIETAVAAFTAHIAASLSEVQSREEGLKRSRLKSEWINWRLSEVQSREEGLKQPLCGDVFPFRNTFRSTIQRRRIETTNRNPLLPTSQSFRSTIQRRRIETQSPYHRRLCFRWTFRSTIQRRRIETCRRCFQKQTWMTSFRSTIQRRRIETRQKNCLKIIRKTFRSTIQRRRIETEQGENVSYNMGVFQKYNPEKKDWNVGAIPSFALPGFLSEVQSREEGLKHVLKVRDL